MRILMMGAGALGGYFGARLAAAGHEVGFVARGAHLAAMQTKGLRIESGRGDLHLDPVTAIASPEEFDAPEIIFLLVKNYDLEEAATQLLPTLTPGSCVVTLQNGISAPERLGAIIGADRVVPGVAYIPADVKAPGVIRHSAELERLIFGPGPKALDVVQRLVTALNATGCDASIAKNIQHTLWKKFIALAALSAMTGLTRLNVGPLRDCPDTLTLFRQAQEETEAVARAVCPDLPPGGTEAAMEMILNVPRHFHASMLDDLNNGKRLELNYLSGDVARLGAAHGVATPLHSFVTAMLQPYVGGPPD